MVVMMSDIEQNNTDSGDSHGGTKNRTIIAAVALIILFTLLGIGAYLYFVYGTSLSSLLSSSFPSFFSPQPDLNNQDINDHDGKPVTVRVDRKPFPVDHLKAIFVERNQSALTAFWTQLKQWHLFRHLFLALLATVVVVTVIVVIVMIVQVASTANYLLDNRQQEQQEADKEDKVMQMTGVPFRWAAPLALSVMVMVGVPVVVTVVNKADAWYGRVVERTAGSSLTDMDLLLMTMRQVKDRLRSAQIKVVLRSENTSSSGGGGDEDVIEASWFTDSIGNTGRPNVVKKVKDEHGREVTREEADLTVALPRLKFHLHDPAAADKGDKDDDHVGSKPQQQQEPITYKDLNFMMNLAVSKSTSPTHAHLLVLLTRDNHFTLPEDDQVTKDDYYKRCQWVAFDLTKPWQTMAEATATAAGKPIVKDVKAKLIVSAEVAEAMRRFADHVASTLGDTQWTCFE